MMDQSWLVTHAMHILIWWGLLTACGLAALPLAFRLFRNLPDRGYTLARSVGLLLTAWILWITTSLSMNRNTGGGVILAWLCVLIVSLLIYRRRSDGDEETLGGWLRENLGIVIATEVVFAGMFFLMVVFRAYNHEIVSTEKFMDFGFINAIRRSAIFPPRDPWMSGYSISYYYFGYLLPGMLANAAGVFGQAIMNGIAYNLQLPTLFALAGVGSMGVVYNLVRSHKVTLPDGGFRPTRKGVALAFGLLATLFVPVLGNLEGVVEVGYYSRAIPELVLEWLDLKDLEDYDAARDPEGELLPGVPLQSWRHWWWWRASRVIKDNNLQGQLVMNPIQEFPMFSWVIGDVHPHVSALPFVIVAVGLALNLALSAEGLKGAWRFGVYGLFLGALYALNTWDAPIYIALVAGADAVRRLIRNGTGHLSLGDWWSVIRLAIMLGVIGLLLFLPFFFGFRSQAAGIIPNVTFPTALQNFFLIFGHFLVILFFFLGVEAWRARETFNIRLSVGTMLAALGVIALVVLVMGLMFYSFADLRAAGGAAQMSSGEAFGAVIARRITHIGTTILLLALIALVLGRLFARAPESGGAAITYGPQIGIVLIMVGAGAMLTLVPEYFYLRDNFGTRINTIFKFYYQAWVLWGLASAYGIYRIFAHAPKPSPILRIVAAVVILPLIFAGLIYSVLAPITRAGFFGGVARLDGAVTMASGDDYAAVQCLMQLEPDADAVIAEAINGCSYCDFARAASISGIPNVLGWPGHEGQWRGAAYPVFAGTRQQDIEELYRTTDWIVVDRIIGQYGIDYVMVGAKEYQQYAEAAQTGLQKFAERYPVACQSGETVIYRTGE